ncbi:hypothetical protein PM082_014142 [Marasmius tenuissimus]|nr:hypothetical protein PM082_014142 [Marasmius tenuissimus]
MTASLSRVHRALLGPVMVIASQPHVVAGAYIYHSRRCQPEPNCSKDNNDITIILAIILPIGVLSLFLACKIKRRKRQKATADIRMTPYTSASANTTQSVERLPEPAHTRVPRQATPPPVYTAKDPANTVTDPVFIQQTTSTVHAVNQATQ